MERTAVHLSSAREGDWNGAGLRMPGLFVSIAKVETYVVRVLIYTRRKQHFYGIEQLKKSDLLRGSRVGLLPGPA